MPEQLYEGRSAIIFRIGNLATIQRDTDPSHRCRALGSEQLLVVIDFRFDIEPGQLHVSLVGRLRRAFHGDRGDMRARATAEAGLRGDAKLREGGCCRQFDRDADRLFRPGRTARERGVAKPPIQHRRGNGPLRFRVEAHGEGPGTIGQEVDRFAFAIDGDIRLGIGPLPCFASSLRRITGGG